MVRAACSHGSKSRKIGRVNEFQNAGIIGKMSDHTRLTRTKTTKYRSKLRRLLLALLGIKTFQGYTSKYWSAFSIILFEERGTTFYDFKRFT
jgi:hypothetical protein